MSSEEKLYYDIRLKAFYSAFSILKNTDDAEDIAQNVCLKFLQKRENISNPKNWSISVAKNEAYALLKKQKKILTGLNDKLDIIQERLIESKKEIVPEFEIISLEEAKELLSKADYKFYKILIKYNQNSEKIAKVTKRSLSYIYGISYRVKRNLKAAKLLKEGYLGSKEIVNYNMHQNILNFIKILQKKMRENNFTKMHNYFREIEISKIPIFDICVTYDYQIHFFGNRLYDLYIPYKNAKDEIKFCILDFKINKLNEIIVTKFYDKPSKVLVVKSTKVIAEFTEKKKGLLIKTKDEAKNILKKYSATEMT